MAKNRKPLHKVTVKEFMTGRYGYDQLSKALMILGMMLLLLTAFMPSETLHMGAYAKYMYLLSILVLGFGYYRMGSKNIKRRKKENETYLKLISGFSKKAKMALENENRAKKYSTFEMAKELAEDGETVIRCYTCRGCGTELRFEEGQGIMNIKCPECGNTLVDRI
jgi:DNA-directed RNA polymerase subunit RPC12/RpoP